MPRSLEAFARILVTGLILDPETRVTDFRSIGRSIMATQSRVHAQFNASTATVNTAAMQQEMSMDDKHCYPPTNHSGPYGSHTMDRSTSTWAGSKIGLVHHPFQVAIEKQQSLSEQNQPYLRHSWNRIDFVAVVSFWIMFGLAITGAETELNRHLYIFRAMSVLRVSRLLAVTTGTTVSTLYLTQWLTLLTDLLDHHALLEDRGPAARQGRSVRSIRNGSLLVSVSSCRL